MTWCDLEWPSLALHICTCTVCTPDSVSLFLYPCDERFITAYKHVCVWLPCTGVHNYLHPGHYSLALNDPSLLLVFYTYAADKDVSASTAVTRRATICLL